MAWHLPRTAAASSSILVLVLVLVSTATAATAKSKPFPKHAIPTMSGYLNINDAHNNSLYYAFYEATDPVTFPAPLLVWLQGGPGCSSLIGNFEEIGPYVLHCTSLTHNPYRWNRRFGVVFIDNPLGSGFSVPVSSPRDIPTDEPTVAAHLHAALQSFMALDDRRFFRARPLFLAGESYAGKYIPAAAAHILRANARLPVLRRLRLQGIAIGNGMTDPVEQVAVHASQAYFAGLINAEQREYLEAMQNETVRLVRDGEWQLARRKRNKILGFLKNATGVATLFNYARAEHYPLRPLTDLLNTREAREALGVRRRDDDVRWVRCRKAVDKALHGDIMRSVRGDVDYVLNKTRVRVLLFQGVFDLHLGPASVEAWVRRLTWPGLEDFLFANRTVWKPWGDGVLAGHVQAWGTLTNVVVAGAGHMAAGDNRPAAQAMIEGWVLQDGPFAGGADGPGQPSATS
ncbi:unnamed protein product [Urochloa decumbens]|uniref:Carboxypeptidase n=1 Tax=Urochloa decumbens TaxID=240449 RepID=A0ABC9DZ94_9POAL